MVRHALSLASRIITLLRLRTPKEILIQETFSNFITSWRANKKNKKKIKKLKIKIKKEEEEDYEDLGENRQVPFLKKQFSILSSFSN